MAESQERLEVISRSIQTLSIIAGVVICVLSFNSARDQEARAREKEANVRLIELQRYNDQRRTEEREKQIFGAQPFLVLRQQRYMEAVQAAATLSNPDDHTPEELAQARKMFRQLYVAELSMVESRGVETAMMDLAKAIDTKLLELTPAQKAAYTLAHALRDSLVDSWQVNEPVTDAPQ